MIKLLAVTLIIILIVITIGIRNIQKNGLPPDKNRGRWII